MDEHPHQNRLINEKSPYLLQHANNPVDWYPWGSDAFQKAIRDDKPIFLSIGYATCHWCHVMEREVFEDPDLAAKMNETFVNIKVDREELPEVDSLYMEFAQTMLGGVAGWPLNLLLTPELRPFYAATYLPPTSQQGLIGMSELITRISEIWNSEERMVIADESQKVVEMFKGQMNYVGTEMPGEQQIEEAAELFFKVADPVYGGIQGAPKFPVGYQHSFLLRYFLTVRDGRALFCAEKALDMMDRGGIHDQLGGGFSRYSVDEQWLVPHFEKMLYDNVILIEAYLKGWLITHKERYQQVAEGIINYILRDMTHEQGGFFSAEDADSEGREGLFYTWTPDEVSEVLGDEAGREFCQAYGVTPEGNFEGRSILHQNQTPDQVATRTGLDAKVVNQTLNAQKKELFKRREARLRPLRDDKILSSWNGLAIHALALAGASLDKPAYLDAAKEAARFVKKNMWKEGRLLRRWREGEARFSAGLDEYAFLIRGTLTLFETTGESEWLAWAMEMADILEKEFKIDDGAFYQTDGTDHSLILRKANFSDGAEPSGNAVHSENLVRLYHFTWKERYLRHAEDNLKAFYGNIQEHPIGHTYHLIALQRYLDKQAPCIVVALNENRDEEQQLREVLFSATTPHRTVIWRKSDDPQLLDLVPHTRNQAPIEGKTSLYICRENTCSEPLNDPSRMKEALGEL
jgi:uncharacterized protein YyaL (SSP411 family)